MKSIKLGLVLLLTAACSQERRPEAWRQVPAGQSPETMGILVDGASVAEMKVLESQGAKVREIYGKSGLYEVFGLNQEAVQDAVGSKAFVSKNEFIPAIKQKEIKFFQERPRIPACDDLEGIPQFGFVSDPQALATMARGPVTLKRNGQKVRVGVGGPGLSQIKYKLGLVMAPSTSALNPETRPGGPLVVDNTHMEFVPDDMGQYIVVVVAQLPSGGGCAKMMGFAVTDDAPFLGHGQAVQIDVAKKLAAFPHLKLIGADQAWPATQGAGVLVAIVDTGVNYNHAALRNNIAVNTREVANNGRDDDGNGLVDDIVGYDFTNNDPYPFDDYMHGTHVAGLAASAVGVAPQAKVLVVKSLGVFGGDVGSVVAGVKYAADAGARVINMSLGSYTPNPALQQAMTYAESKGSLIVIASGNDGIDIEQRPVFPASYPNQSILVVTATDNSGSLTPYGNYGSQSVDIAAPGGTEAVGLNSAFYANTKNQMWFAAHGTSMASPVVAGVAALAISANPKLNAVQIKQLLMERGTARPDYRGRVLSSKLVDARALGVRLP